MDAFESSTYLIGDWLEGRYRIEDIRKGSMGIVYLCADSRTDRPIAFKTFEDRYLNSEESRRRFLEEALVWIQLEHHPNIIQAYLLTLIDGKPHLLVERVMADNPRGATLKDFYFSRAVPQRATVQIAIHICSGMVHALRKFPNLVHRDLKMENILIGADEMPKISDFGMSLMWEQIPRSPLPSKHSWQDKIRPLELSGRMEGTPAFASPEQCLCQPLDTRSDIYSFGCILYQMTTKRLPFCKSTVEEHIVAHLREIPVPPAERNPIVHPLVSSLILKCLEKKPEKRYSNFEALRFDLETIYLQLVAEPAKSFTHEIPLTLEERLDRAKSYLLLRRFKEVEKELDEAYRLNRHSPEIPLLQGKLSLLQKNYSAAIAGFEKAMFLKPDDPSIYELLGRTYAEQNLLTDAVHSFRVAVRLKPAMLSAYLELAEIFQKQNAGLQAEQILLEGLKYCADRSRLYTALADLYHRSEDWKKEREAIAKAIEANPTVTENLIRLAILCLQTNDRRAALKWARQAVEMEPDSFAAWYGLGSVYEKIQDWVKAAEAWSKASTLSRGNSHFQAELSALYYRLRRYDEAWQHAVHAEEMGGDVESLKREIQRKRF